MSSPDPSKETINENHSRITIISAVQQDLDLLFLPPDDNFRQS